MFKTAILIYKFLHTGFPRYFAPYLSSYSSSHSTFVYLVYLGFYVAFNTVQVISRRVVGRAEETSTYSSLGFCTVNCRPTASNYQLSHLRPWRGSNPSRRGESVTTLPPWPLLIVQGAVKVVAISLSFQSSTLLFTNLSKQFGNSFAFDAPTVGNALREEIHASPSLASFRKQLQTYLYTKAYPP